MKATITGGQILNGAVTLPGSKAYSHRALVAGLLSEGETILQDRCISDDTRATIRGIQALGGSVTEQGTTSHVIGAKPIASSPIMCDESGATLRFLTAVSCLSMSPVTLVADGTLASRPIEPLLNALRTLGATIVADRTGALVVNGPLKGGRAAVNGDISSQFISAMLLVSPRAERAVQLDIKGRIESRPYVDMTLHVLKKHGVSVQETANGFEIDAPQKYHHASHEVPRDFSSASYLMTAAATIGRAVTLNGIHDPIEKIEPDYRILTFLQSLGVNVATRPDRIDILEAGPPENFEFNAIDNPDLVPSLEVLACYARGQSRITGIGRLRFKESNRLVTVPAELKKLGARIKSSNSEVVIKGGRPLKGATVDSHSDHRVVLACGAAAIGARGKTTIHEADAVSKSYPAFFNDLSVLGAKLNVE